MLSHFLEEEGVPTTGISLVRLHTKTIEPPRALWVPFELGRPLGVPNNPAFQKRVLMAVLRLLEERSGPVLEDFPEEAPVSDEDPVILACPYVPAKKDTALSEMERLCSTFEAEIVSLRPWYDMAVQKHQRTTVGVSKLLLDDLSGFICSFLIGDKPCNPREDVPLAYELKYAADDLKAYYFEAVSAQPGMTTSDGETGARWFWEETVAGKVLMAVRDACLKSDDELLKGIATGQIVPRRFQSSAKK